VSSYYSSCSLKSSSYDLFMFKEKVNRNFPMQVVIPKMRSLLGFESNLEYIEVFSYRSRLLIKIIGKHCCFRSSPQPAKVEPEEKTEKDDFFPTDPDNVNYIVHLNDTTFDAFLLQNAQAPILTMFYAPCTYLSVISKIVT
jgi:hypothetical protein